MTREQLTKLHEISEQEKIQKDLSSELLRTAQDRFGHVIHKLVREGKDVEITEKTLWHEVFLHPAGENCEAGKILKIAHPEVFEAYKKQGELAMQIKTFCLSEFGFDYSQMTISDYLLLTEGLFKLLISENSN